MLKKKIICYLFHKIDIISSCAFVDKISGKCVGEYRCEKCNRTFLSNSKNNLFRVTVKE